MRTLFLICISLIILSCKNARQKETEQKVVTSASTATAPSLTTKIQSAEKIPDAEPLVADSGQTWYKVTVTRNDSAYINYEGSWPVLLTTDGFATLAFTARKGALVISHGLTFYLYGWPYAIGRVPVLTKATKKNEISMIMVPEENGAYGLAISPDTGYVEITKNEDNGKLVSGYFEARATNANKDIYKFKGQFLNIKPHGS
jgi:hypothetical protein